MLGFPGSDRRREEYSDNAPPVGAVSAAGMQEGTQNCGLSMDSSDQAAEDQDSVDLIREFYLAKLGQVVPESPIRPLRHAESAASSRASTPPGHPELHNRDSHAAKKSYNVDHGLVNKVGAINRQLEEYYSKVNEYGTCSAWTSEDPVSGIYLDTCESRWPKPSEVLGFKEQPADLREALYELDRRDEICRKIISVQHCSLLAMNSAVPRGSPEQSDNQAPSRDAMPSSQKSSDAKEVDRLRRMVELYKNELARLYEA